MDRNLIKKEAWNLTKEKFLDIWKALIINFVISLAYVVVFNYILKGLNQNVVSIIAMLYNLITIPFSFGLNKYLLAIIRKQEHSIKDLFYYYKHNIIETIVLSMILSLCYSIGLVLYLIPAIIMYLFLSFSENCLVDGTINPIDALAKSCNLMKGYKWDYFNFLISYLLWFFVGICTMGLAFIWVLPYFTISQKIYYLKLLELKEPKKQKTKAKAKTKGKKIK